MDKEYKEIIRNNFLEWAEKALAKKALAKKEYKEIIGIMYFAWLEATRQADERNSLIKMLMEVKEAARQADERNKTNFIE